MAWLTMLYLYDPARTKGFLACPIWSLTGHPCPGCGAQRSVHHCLHGDFATAVQLCPYLYFVLIVVFVCWMCPKISKSLSFVIVVVGVTLLYSAARFIGMVV